jgi:hypothetical protein
MPDKKRLLIATAVWGEWHINKLLDLNLPTLLAPGNFPALARSCEITYLIYTSAADLPRLREAPGFKALGELMRLEFRTISAAALAAPIEAHHEYWADATERAKREGSFILLMPPDVAWSDGSFAHVGKLLGEGKKAIFMTYLRSESESFSTVLGGRRTVGTLPLSVTGSELVEIALRTLHPLMAAYLRGSEHFPIHPEMMLWAVPGEGLACRMLAREMFVYDPATVTLNRSNLLESEMDPALMHVIEDSDDLFAVSLAPIDKEYAWYRWPRRADPDEVADWWLNYDSWANDLLVSAKLRWHMRPVSEAAWRATETSADLFLRRAALLREGRYLWRAARAQACTMSARLLAGAAASGVLARMARGRGGAVVFIPANNAYWDVPAGALDHIQTRAGAADMAQLLRAHYAPSATTRQARTLEAELGGGRTCRLAAGDGGTLTVERRADGLAVNGVRILGGPIPAGKQLMYLVERLLVPVGSASPLAVLPAVRAEALPAAIPAVPGTENMSTTQSAPAQALSGVTPVEYDACEQRGVAELPIPVMMAFKPVTFERYSYPTHISEMRAVLRYADHNSEAEVPGLFKPGATFAPIGYVNEFTADERELLATLRGRVASALLADFGRAIKPVTNLLVQIGPFRVMSHIAQALGRSPLTLFEVGPGAAYIGAMMSVAGHRYLSYDVTQSLYIWQQYMLRAVAGGAFAETAGLPAYSPPESARIVHLPWWQYVKFLQDCPVSADVVYSNSNLGEMSPLALKHVLHISRRMLQDSPVGLFAYFSTGMTAQSSPEQIAAAFSAAGYTLAMKEPFMAYVLEGRDPTPVQQAFRNGIPFYDPSGRGGKFDANSVMALKRSEAPLDVDLAAWNYGWTPPYVD